MNILESNICIICEGLKSNEIESLVSELQMIADRKYQEEEAVKIWKESIGAWDIILQTPPSQRNLPD